MDGAAVFPARSPDYCAKARTLGGRWGWLAGKSIPGSRRAARRGADLDPAMATAPVVLNVFTTLNK